MKMFLTRLGNNSKAVITGDVTQVDLPPGRTSGLIEAQSMVAAVSGIRFVYFDDTDVVRHLLVQSIIKAYAEYRNGRAPTEIRGGHRRRRTGKGGRRVQRPPSDSAGRE